MNVLMLKLPVTNIRQKIKIVIIFFFFMAVDILNVSKMAKSYHLHTATLYIWNLYIKTFKKNHGSNVPFFGNEKVSG